MNRRIISSHPHSRLSVPTALFLPYLYCRTEGFKTTCSSILRSTCMFVLVVAAGNCAQLQADEKITPAAVKLGRPVDFMKDIKPILASNCQACHSTSVKEGELSLESVKTILKGGDSGPAAIARQPDKSPLYLAATRDWDSVMPPLPNKVQAKALTPQELGLVRQWIVEGAQESKADSSARLAWKPLPDRLKSIHVVALSPWGRYAAYARANQVTVVDVARKVETAALVDPLLQSAAQAGQQFGPATHLDFVNAIAFSPDGQLIATGGYRNIKLWQKRQQPISTQWDSPEPATSVALANKSTQAAYGSAQGKIFLLDPSHSKIEHTITGHNGAVTGLQFSDDDTRLYSAGADKTIRIWNLADRKETLKLTTDNPIVGLAVRGNDIITAHDDHVLRLWNAPAESSEEPLKPVPLKPVKEFKGHSQPITHLLPIRPQPGLVVSASGDKTVRIWDVAKGNQVRALTHSAPVTSLAVSADGLQILAGGSNGITRLWTHKDGKQLAELKNTLQADRDLIIKSEANTVAKQKVALAKTAMDAAEKNTKEREDSLKKSKELVTKAEKDIEPAKKKSDEAAAAAKKADDELAKKTDDANLKKMSEAAEKKAKAALDEYNKAVKTLESAKRNVARSEKNLENARKRAADAKQTHEAALAFQKQQEAVEAEARKALAAAVKPIRSVAFSKSGQQGLIIDESNTMYHWDLATQQTLDALQGPQAVAKAILPLTDEKFLFVSDKLTALVNTSTQWQLVAQLGTNGNPADLFNSQIVDRVYALAFSPDSKLLASGGGEPSRSGELLIWDVAQKKLVKQIEDAHSDTICDVEFSRDGSRLLSGAADKFAKIFDASSGKMVKSFEGHTHHVLGVAWKADGSAIATAGADNAIKVWNVETGDQIRTINNYSKQVTAVDYIGVGDNIVSCGGDKNVKFHTASNGRNYRNFTGNTDYAHSVAASRDESIVVAGGEDGILRIWDGKKGSLLKAFEPVQAAPQ